MQAASDMAACRDLMREGSKSFSAASRLLPKRMRDDTIAFYAFCRIADDLIDDSENPELGLLELRSRLERIYEANPWDHPVDRAFAQVAHRRGLPKQVLLAMLEGFAWDRDKRRYQTLDELLGYCARVASTVGVMMTVLMGRNEPHVIARACDLGLAMQLTNIARDIGEDARRGRLYLPLHWLAERGLDPEKFLSDPQWSPEIGDMTARLLEVAESFYSQADLGIPMLPRDSRVGIQAARLIYADIGRVIRKNGFDSVSRRAVTSKWRKLGLLLNATDAWFYRRKETSLPAHPSIRFLVDLFDEQSAEAVA
ncbi:MAG: phytoene/squalene synthase family protein [Myxococcota bacterium]|jgi:phytoene synthase|nr:phytoene/squalene synthase family protein [Myxococcota bacterium]